MEKDRCPACGAPVDRDEVDIGVGTIYGPRRCADQCGWAECPDCGEAHDGPGCWAKLR